ncbi:MAG: hypothetical protein HBSIN02_04890 [Bacteroidia bacterium]|nr:MAG: hypothetical protein HBSIN02_04890 [Bacteroidia bacterium]
MKSLLLSVLLIVLLTSCDGGLTLPPLIEPALEGTITVQSPWPPQDSVKNLWLFASQIFPVDSANIFSGIFSGSIIIYPGLSLDSTLAYNVNVQTFHAKVPPATYYYIGILARHGDQFLETSSYRVVGILEEGPGQPRTVIVRNDEVVSGLQITVDFYNLPPQPF